jgi:putative glutamine amidotransferase
MQSQQLQSLDEAESRLCDRIAAMLLAQRPTCFAQQPFGDLPKIGVFAARGTLREGAWQSYAGDQSTIDAIAEAGGCPLLLPTYAIIPGLDAFDLLLDEEAFRHVFNTIWPVMRDLDGLVFTGGGDLDSRFFYRKIPHPRLAPPDFWRDTWEWFSMLICWALLKTTFGICRGAQLMNVALRGELIQDQGDLRKYWKKGMPALLKHRRGRPVFKNFTDHPVYIVPESVLARAVGGGGERAARRYYLDQVLTQHHNFIGLLRPDSMQVIGDLAEGLEVVGYAPDRIIEAVASKDPRRMFWAVQFHPEYMRSLAWASGIFSSIVESSSRDAPIPRAQFEYFREEVLAWLWLCGRTLHELKTDTPESVANASGRSPVAMRETDELSKERAPAALQVG